MSRFLRFFAAGAFGLLAPFVGQAGDSYYLMYCDDKKTSAVKPLAEVQDAIRKRLEQVERQKATQRWIDGLREKAYIKVF